MYRVAKPYCIFATKSNISTHATTPIYSKTIGVYRLYEYCHALVDDC